MTGGTGSGIPLIPSRFLLGRPGHATQVKGLYLCEPSARGSR